MLLLLNNIFRTVVILIINLLLLIFVIAFAHIKTKNFSFSNSVVDQEFDFNYDSVIKNNYNLFNQDKLSDNYLIDILLRYSIQSRYQNFVLFEGTPQEISGSNLVNYIKGSKDNQYKCFLFAYNRDNLYEVTAYISFINYLKTSGFPFGISILGVGYEDKFKKYSIGIKKFINDYYHSKNRELENCIFMSDGVYLSIQESLKNNFIMISPYGKNGNPYQYPYVQILTKYKEKIKDTKYYLIDENQKYEYKLTNFFNMFLHKIGVNMDYAYILTSIKKLLMFNPNEGHIFLLEKGINSLTLKLFINPQGKVITTLKNYMFLINKMYNTSNSNDHLSFSTQFIYMLYDFDNCVYKDQIIISAIVSACVMLIIVFIYSYYNYFTNNNNYIYYFYDMFITFLNINFICHFILKSDILFTKYGKYIFKSNNSFELCNLDNEYYSNIIIKYFLFVIFGVIIIELLFIILFNIVLKINNKRKCLKYYYVYFFIILTVLIIGIHNIGYTCFYLVINFIVLPFIFLKYRVLKVLCASILLYYLMVLYNSSGYYKDYLWYYPRIASCSEDNIQFKFVVYVIFSSIYLIFYSILIN